jgi:hypothetical protein
MTELHWGESIINLHGCSADRPHQNTNNVIGIRERVRERLENLA